MRPVLVDPTVPSVGLRERKKQQARQRIAGAAHDLFVEHGFDQVTIADVAAAADVSVKTVFNYFGTKEDLAFDGEEQVLAAWLNTVRRRRAEDTPLDAIRQLIETRFDGDVAVRLEAFGALVGDSADLQSRLRLFWDRLEMALTRLLASETGATNELDLALHRLEAARLVSLPRLFLSDDVRRFVNDQPEPTAAVGAWLDRALTALGEPPR